MSGRGGAVRDGVRHRDGSVLQPLGLPTPVEVRANGRGRPAALREKRRRWERVVQIQESWRIDDEWWRRPVARLYHRVVLESGRTATLYRDLVDGTWYVQ
jgi:hypothetical protein